MQGLSLYPEQNDLKAYLEKVTRVFSKMEKDLGTYRLKEYNPERCLKMLRKRAQVSELVFQNLFQNMLDQETDNEYAALFQQIDKFLKQHQNQVISFINGYFRSKHEQEQAQLMCHTDEPDLNHPAAFTDTLEDSLLEQNTVIMQATHDTITSREGSPTTKLRQSQPLSTPRTNNDIMLLKSTNLAHNVNRFKNSMVDKIKLKLLPHEQTSPNKRRPAESRMSTIQQAPVLQRPQNELLEKIKRLDMKVKVQDEQIRQMEQQYEKIFLEKGQLQRNFENLRKMNELLIQNEMKQTKAQDNKEVTGNLKQEKKYLNEQKRLALIDRKNNNQFQKLVDNLQQFQMREGRPAQEDTSAIKKIFGQREKMAIEKVSYWGDVRKGLKDKMHKINTIQSSNVRKHLESLMADLEHQKQRFLDNENKKQMADDSDEEYPAGYEKKKELGKDPVKKDQGTSPDHFIYDIKKIHLELDQLIQLKTAYEEEIAEKNAQIKKVTSQMQSLLKVLEETSNRQQKDKNLIQDLHQSVSHYKKLYLDAREQINFVKNELGIDPVALRKTYAARQQRNLYGNKNDSSSSDVPAILQRKYEDPRKVTDVKKLQDMCVELQNENYDLRLRIHELETLLKKHNIAIPQGSASLYSKEALQQMAQENYEQARLKEQEKRNGKKGQQGDHKPQDSFNKEKMLLEGKKLFEKEKKAQKMMQEARQNFHNLSAAEQQKFLSQLTPEQQQNFINSLNAEQKKKFMREQMKNGNKEFMEQMMENFDALDEETKKEFLKNMTKEQQQKFFKDKEQFEEKKKEMQRQFENYDNMTAEEKQAFLNNMTEDEKKTFFAKKQQYEEKKAQDKFMDNMMRNYDKLTEKEKQEFLSNMTEEQRTKFFQRKQELEQEIKREKQKKVEEQIKNYEKLTDKEKEAFLNSLSKEERQAFLKNKESYDKKQKEEYKELKKQMDNFDKMTAEQQKAFLANMTPEQQQQFIRKNKKTFLENMAKNFDKMTAEEQTKFLQNLTPEQQREFFQAKAQVAKEQKMKQEKQEQKDKALAHQAYQKDMEQMLMEQVRANAKKYYDKKLQTGDDNVESFENNFVSEFYQNQQMKQFKDVMKRQEDIKKKAEARAKGGYREDTDGDGGPPVGVNAKGQLVNRKGQLVNKEGHLVDEKGRLVNKEGHLVDKEGRLVDENGKVIKKRGRRIKVVGPNGEVQYVTEDSEDDKPVKRKKRVINANGEIEYVTDNEPEDPNRAKRRKKRMVDEKGNVFYVTDSDDDPVAIKHKREQQAKAKAKRMQEAREEEERKDEELKQISKRLQKEMEKKIRDRGNKGGYLDGGDEINPAEMEYLYNMMKHEYQLKGEGMFSNKGDHVMNMFKHLFKFGKDAVMPTHEQFREFMERIQKMHLKCGNDCKHLKRFFTRLGFVRRGWWTNRQVLRMNQNNIQPVQLPKIADNNLFGKKQ